MDTEFELVWQNSKDKEFARLFWNKFNVSDFSTRFFTRLVTRLYRWFEYIQGGIVQKWAEGKQKLLRDSGRLKLSRVPVTEGKITVNDIQGKSTLVRVSARLELARVRVVGSQLYVQEIMIHFHHTLRTDFWIQIYFLN